LGFLPLAANHKEEADPDGEEEGGHQLARAVPEGKPTIIGHHDEARRRQGHAKRKPLVETGEHPMRHKPAPIEPTEEKDQGCGKDPPDPNQGQ
jgi:hypothetical protein